jgi:hypothetical protein
VRRRVLRLLKVRHAEAAPLQIADRFFQIHAIISQNMFFLYLKRYMQI